MKLYACILSVISLSLVMEGWSQSNDPSVKVMGRATHHSVKLRWGPDAPSAWQLANEYGYTIERVTLSVNGRMLENPVRTILNNTPLKPAEQNLWETAIDQDDYVAIAAQAIFGETFELEDYHSDMVKVIHKARELESRFSFALFSADQSPRAAELSGLYFEDKTVDPAARYVYRVYANVPARLLKIDTGFVFLGVPDYKSLPKIRDVNAQFDDRMAMISWNGGLMDKIYNSFWVERSDDKGKTFKKITERPIVNTYSGEVPSTNTVYKIDTLSANDIVYHYRVIGINGFGEMGPPSDTVSGFGRSSFSYNASIFKHNINSDGRVELEWTFPEAGAPLVKSFDLMRMNLKTKVAEKVMADIDRSARQIIDDKPRSSNYYIIAANDKYGRSNRSFPYLVQLEDSIPPAPPVEVDGSIDTLGHVYLTWKANEEDDLAGYHIYKANFRSDEFIMIPGSIVETNAYVDTIELSNLTEEIHYKVQAVDKRFNPSDFSRVITVKKPDVVPPVPPVFKLIKSDSSGVYMSWIRSSSEDADLHLLYRKHETDAEWELIKTFTRTDTTAIFRDMSVQHRTSYSYTILAVDDDGLESVPASPVNLRWIALDPYPPVESIYYTIDKSKKSITVSWDYMHGEIDKFLVYKANNGKPLQLYKSISATEQQVSDSYNISDTNVEYRIVASFKTGERTRLSKPVTIKM